MKKYLLPMLLSAFVLPGSGQIYNGERRKGAVFIGLTVGLLLTFSVTLAVYLSQMLPSDRGFLSPAEVSAFATRLRVERPGFLALFQWSLTAVWAYGILDAYLGARARVRREADEPRAA